MTVQDVEARLADAVTSRAALERLRGHPSRHGTEAARRQASAEVDRLTDELRGCAVGEKR